MPIPVTTFQPLSFEQAAPGVAGLKAGLQMGNLVNQNIGEGLKNSLQAMQNQFTPQKMQADINYRKMLTQFYPQQINAQMVGSLGNIMNSLYQKQIAQQVGAAMRHEPYTENTYGNLGDQILKMLGNRLNTMGGGAQNSQQMGSSPDMQSSTVYNQVQPVSGTSIGLPITSQQQQKIYQNSKQLGVNVNGSTGMSSNNQAQQPYSFAPTTPEQMQEGINIGSLAAQSTNPQVAEMGRQYATMQREGTPMQAAMTPKVVQRLSENSDLKAMFANGKTLADEYKQNLDSIPDFATWPAVRGQSHKVLTAMQNLQNVSGALTTIINHMNKLPARAWTVAEQQAEGKILGNPTANSKQALLDSWARVNKMLSQNYANAQAENNYIHKGGDFSNFVPIQVASKKFSKNPQLAQQQYQQWLNGGG